MCVLNRFRLCFISNLEEEKKSHHIIIMCLALSIVLLLRLLFFWLSLHIYIRCKIPINKKLLASDGLWDGMTSQEVVNFVNEMLECPTQSVKTKKGKIILTPEFRRRKMARFVAHEALERGSADNVCVILVWLKKDKK